MTIQTYRDVTFVFGPPSGDRYEMLKHVASKTGRSFCCVYQEYMGKMFDGWTKDNLLDKTFSAILGVGTQVNRLFPSYQMRIDRKEEFEKRKGEWRKEEFQKRKLEHNKKELKKRVEESKDKKSLDKKRVEELKDEKSLDKYENMSYDELKQEAKTKGIKNYWRKKREQLAEELDSLKAKS